MAYNFSISPVPRQTPSGKFCRYWQILCNGLPALGQPIFKSYQVALRTAARLQEVQS